MGSPFDLEELLRWFLEWRNKEEEEEEEEEEDEDE